MEFARAFFLYRTALKVGDALIVVSAWYLCWFLRFESSLIPITKGIPEFSKYSYASLPLVLTFMVVMHTVGAYRADRTPFGFRAMRKIVQGSILATLVFIAFLYFFEQGLYSRIFLAMFGAIVIALLLAERLALHLVWRWFETHRISPFRILLIGHGDLLQMYFSKLQQKKPYPIFWVGHLGQKDPQFENILHLGDESQLLRTVEQRKVDRVIASYPPGSHSKYPPILKALSNELVEIKLLPDFGTEETFTYRAEHELGVPLLQFNHSPVSQTDLAFKRLFDLFGATVGVTLLSPLYLVIALLIKLTSKGPIFYSQTRVGADGRIFECHKFRSMLVDAEDVSGPVWAVKGDARTTPIGKWLRKTNLDELPQLYNVLIGNMSLVGPRPERPVFVKQFKGEIPKYMQRHKMKSGLTGWAQVNGWRGNTSISERIKHDLFYITNWSHVFDIKIIVLTLVKSFKDENAY